VPNSSGLTASLPTSITCPAGHYAVGSTGINSDCRSVSQPILDNDVFWQNRSFFIGVGNLGTGNQNQQNVVSLYDAFTTTLAPSQPQADATSANGGGTLITGGTGACVTPVSYWEIGVRGDTSRLGGSGFRLVPRYSVFTDAVQYPGLFDVAGNPDFVSQYCNGSRVPPELGSMGYLVNPGTNENNAPNPIFTLTPSATVDEGNNWINMRWGPLSLTHPVTGATLGNFAPTAGSSVINLIPSTANGATGAYTLAPALDFFGNARKLNNFVDAGAIEFGVIALPTLNLIAPSTGVRSTNVNVTLTGTNLTGATAVNVSGTGVTVTNVVVVNSTTVTATFAITAGATLGARNVTVVTPGGTSGNVTFTVLGATLTSIAPNAGVRNTAVNVTITGTTLGGATAVNVSGTGVTVSNVVFVNGTTITATFTIAVGATLGARNVTVVTPIGTSSSVAFTVQGPTLTSINPTLHTRGGAGFTVTLTGINLSGATNVTVSGTGVTVSAVTAVNATTVTATFTISPTATQSSRLVAVVTPIGTTNTVAFRVQ
jgi:hypothetical protein